MKLSARCIDAWQRGESSQVSVFFLDSIGLDSQMRPSMRSQMKVHTDILKVYSTWSIVQTTNRCNLT